MNRIALFLALALCSVLVSCGPTAYVTQLQVRYPSSSGIDLEGKSMATVFLYEGADSLFTSSEADAFASGLEAEYFGGEQVVGVYSMPKEEGGDYSSRDSLAALVLELDADVIFLIDAPVIVENDDVRSAVTRLYSYDSRGGSDDSVHMVQTNVILSWLQDTDAAARLGRSLSGRFASQWKTEVHSVIAYEDWLERWIEPIYDVQDMDWTSAVDKWLKLLDTNSLEKRSCAEYNIALGCYLCGEYKLAKEWLDRSDSDKLLSVSAGLRSHLKERLGE